MDVRERILANQLRFGIVNFVATRLQLIFALNYACCHKVSARIIPVDICQIGVFDISRLNVVLLVISLFHKGAKYDISIVWPRLLIGYCEEIAALSPLQVVRGEVFLLADQFYVDAIFVIFCNLLRNLVKLDH